MLLFHLCFYDAVCLVPISVPTLLTWSNTAPTDARFLDQPQLGYISRRAYCKCFASNRPLSRPFLWGKPSRRLNQVCVPSGYSLTLLELSGPSSSMEIRLLCGWHRMLRRTPASTLEASKFDGLNYQCRGFVIWCSQIRSFPTYFKYAAAAFLIRLMRRGKKTRW